MFRVRALPGEKKPVKILRRNRLNLCTKPIDREPMNPREQSPVAPFLFGRLPAEALAKVGVGIKFAAQDETFPFEREQRGLNFRPRQT
jgi:hypothetical protein